MDTCHWRDRRVRRNAISRSNWSILAEHAAVRKTQNGLSQGRRRTAQVFAGRELILETRLLTSIHRSVILVRAAICGDRNKLLSEICIIQGFIRKELGFLIRESDSKWTRVHHARSAWHREMGHEKPCAIGEDLSNYASRPIRRQQIHFSDNLAKPHGYVA
jgi:hypothetical protein